MSAAGTFFGADGGGAWGSEPEGRISLAAIGEASGNQSADTGKRSGARIEVLNCFIEGAAGALEKLLDTMKDDRTDSWECWTGCSWNMFAKEMQKGEFFENDNGSIITGKKAVSLCGDRFRLAFSVLLENCLCISGAVYHGGDALQDGREGRGYETAVRCACDHVRGGL